MTIDLSDIVPFPIYTPNSRGMDDIFLSRPLTYGTSIRARKIEEYDGIYGFIIRILRIFRRWWLGETAFTFMNGTYELNDNDLLKRLGIDQKKYKRASYQDKVSIIRERILELKINPSDAVLCEEPFLRLFKDRLCDDCKVKIAEYLDLSNLQIFIRKLMQVEENPRVISQLYGVLLGNRHFKFGGVSFDPPSLVKKEILKLISPSIPNLRELCLVKLDLTKDELKNIISCCPELELIRHVDMDVFNQLIKQCISSNDPDLERLRVIYRNSWQERFKRRFHELRARDFDNKMKKIYMEALTEEDIVYEELDLSSLRINFNRVDLMSTKDYEKIFSKFQYLRKLDLFECLNAPPAIHLLPSTLQEFKYDSLISDISEECIEKLPGGLTRLSLRMVKQNGRDWRPDIFSRFHSLTDLNIIDTVGVIDFFTNLPPQLKKLTYRVNDDHRGPQIGLEIPSFSADLEELTIESDVGARMLKHYVRFKAETLPRSLTTLHLKDSMRTELSLDNVIISKENWPQSLTALKLNRWSYMTSELMGKLPSTIRKLTFRPPKNGKELTTFVLPESLEILELIDFEMSKLKNDYVNICCLIQNGHIARPPNFKTIVLKAD